MDSQIRDSFYENHSKSCNPTDQRHTVSWSSNAMSPVFARTLLLPFDTFNDVLVLGAYISSAQSAGMENLAHAFSNCREETVRKLRMWEC
jgi:hypothetical protein